MKREIKFRGKRLDNGEWIYGNVHFPNKLFTGVFICPDTTYGDVAPGMEDGDNFEEFKKHGAAIGHYHRVIPESVGEFTGLKDKNGKEIYEGDIVRFNEFYEGDYKQREGVAVIVWDEEGHSVCQVDKEDGEEFYICSTWDLSKNYGGEIIGNIYQNPELIKE